jgi:hypothetical protein
MRPIADAGDQAVLDRIEGAVLDVAAEIFAAATIRSFSARGQRRRRCIDVITSTCTLVIGLSLGLVLSLPIHPHAVKAAITGIIMA